MLVCLQAIDTPEERTRFEEIYLAYRGLMFHVAYNILKQEQDAEDVVHQSFLKLAEHMELVAEGPGPRTRTLVATIAERKAIDLYRAKQRRGGVNLDTLSLGREQEQPVDGSLPAAMAALPPRYREVLLLRYYNGYSNREIAAFLSTTPANVGQLLHRAREKLADMLREQEVQK